MIKEKYLVTIYQETYTTVEVEANDKHEAEDLALMGEGEVDDVTVKSQEMINVKHKLWLKNTQCHVSIWMAQAKIVYADNTMNCLKL